MTSITTPRRVRVATWAVFAVFFLNGINFATWASRLPAIRDQLGFDEAQMGVLMLSASIGSIVALPLSGWVVQRIGAARAVAIFAVVNVLGLAGAAICVVQDAPLGVRIGLVACGVGTGVWDASMNLEGAAVEQRLGKAIMPKFHAGFSFGTMAGAGIGAVAAAVNAPLTVHLLIVLAISLVAVLASVRYFLPASDAGHGADPVDLTHDAAIADPAIAAGVAGEADAESGAARGGVLAAWVEPRTLLIGLVVLAAALTEGSANDWVSLAVVDGFNASDALGAIGLAVFLTAMTGMRLLGTGLLDRYGRVAVLRLCGLLALAGLAVFVFAPSMWLALVGVALWGLGAALGFPVGMSAASDDPRRAAARVSVVSTIGYSAFFVGPPLIGMLAQHLGYRHALVVIAVPIVIGLAVVTATRPLPTAAGGQGAPRKKADDNTNVTSA